MIEANIVSKVELMLGKEKMRNMYTSNDLIGLIEFLSKHSSKQEAIGFITTLVIGFTPTMLISMDRMYMILYGLLAIISYYLIKELL